MSKHGGNLRKAVQQFGDLQFIDFSANINPLGVPIEWKQCLCETIDNGLHFYPDPECETLRLAIAQRDNVPVECVWCGNGASECIQLAFEALRPATALLFAPCFYDYIRSAKLSGAAIRWVYLKEEDNWSVDLETIDLQGIDLIMLAQPNNPTSRLFQKDALLALVKRACNLGIICMIDEAFIELTLEGKDASICSDMEQLPNLILIRAFTKSFAVPGLRLGYMIAEKQLLKSIRDCQVTWSVNAFAQSIAQALPNTVDYMTKTRLWLKSELSGQYSRMQEVPGMISFTPQTNFILSRLNSGHSELLRECLAQQGILIRVASNFEGLDERYFRTAIRSQSENIHLVKTLKNILPFE